ncbi:MAG: HAMP domain-containing sensor histidine kinase [Gelidibacter sp.]
MNSAISVEDKLKERIKELTCLYKVSSYIANSNIYDLKPTFQAIAVSLKEAIRYSDEAFVEINLKEATITTGQQSKDNVYILSAIKVFNATGGTIKIGYPKLKYTQNAFLEEEKQLVNKLALEIGNLLERKQIIENEEATKRQMERADRLGILGEITAGIAHELNTPLANILGFTELLKERFADNDQVLKDLEKIMHSAIYSREVVKKLMFFSCEMPQQMERADIVPIIKNAIQLLNPNFAKKNLQVQLHFNQEALFLKVDTIQLTQVIFNLVINAIYFSPQNGRITIDVNDEVKNIVLKISDEGSGIPSDKAEHIFNPFYTSKPIGEGSGLGLSVVHGIIKSHKGSIGHQPNTPKGTIFTITFPKS